MDLSKLKNDQKLDLCRWYFRGGFFCLPFVWLVNAVWFFDEAFKKPTFDEQKKIKIYVVLSAIGAALWAVGLSVWVYIFQTHRAEWGEFGDYLSFVIPTDMGSEEVLVVAPGQNEDPNDAVPPQVGLLVTADVRVVQYRSSESLGNCEGTKCTVVTSLSAVFNESLIRSLRSQPCCKTEECIAGTIKTPVLLLEACDHPVVRRSKKHTQLNSLNMSELIVGRRAQIDRTVLLPYMGCINKSFKPFQSHAPHIPASSSKSWETVVKSNKAKELKPFRSLTFNSEGSTNNISSELKFLDYQNLVANEQLIHPPGENDLPNTDFNLSKVAVRSFYLIKTPISGTKTFDSSKSKVKKGNHTGEQSCNSAIPLVSYMKTKELQKNVNGFEREIFHPQVKLNFKATRNVSILHRPKTRDKSTSTTSLDELQDIDKSVQGLLMPYISTGRDCPSEIILKLMPKAEAFNNSLNKNIDQSNRSKSSSEVNLLAPTLNSQTKPKKKSKKSGNMIWNFCFSNKKNTDDEISGDSADKEVYYPSIVEVHNNKNQLSSNWEDSVSSFHTADKKNRQSYS